jgi:hypothetical protein
MKYWSAMVAALMLAGTAPLSHAAPDWSGLWEGEGAALLGKAVKPTANKDDANVLKLFAPVHPPFKPELESKYQAALRDTGKIRDSTACDIAEIFPRVMDGGLGMLEFLITPKETAIISSLNQVRHIYTDGRSHPPAEELWPTPMGDSVGHWEGDTLVIDTVATKPAIAIWLFNPEGAKWLVLPVSSKLRFKERIRMVDNNHIENRLTVEDPESLSTAWTRTFDYHRVTDINRMIPENCTDNERNPIVNGTFDVELH